MNDFTRLHEWAMLNLGSSKADDLLALVADALHSSRSAALEEAAKVADKHAEYEPCEKCSAVHEQMTCAEVLAAAIRALKGE